MDKNLSGYKKSSQTRDSLGRLTTPYSEKRSQARGVRFPPDIDDWLISQKEQRNCSFDDLMIEPVQLFFKTFSTVFSGQDDGGGLTCKKRRREVEKVWACLLYTSDAADE